jgi:hypothetical protein
LPFPDKKNKQLSDDEVEERRLILDQFLKKVESDLNDNRLFRQFLNVRNDTIHYKEVFQRQPTAKPKPIKTGLLQKKFN